MTSSENATPTKAKIHNYVVRGMGSLQFLQLSHPAACGQVWRWVCPQNANLSVPGFGLGMGDTFRIDRCIDGDEPDPKEQNLGKLYRTCEVTFVGNRNSDSAVPDATGLLVYSF